MLHSLSWAWWWRHRTSRPERTLLWHMKERSSCRDLECGDRGAGAWMEAGKAQGGRAPTGTKGDDVQPATTSQSHCIWLEECSRASSAIHSSLGGSTAGSRWSQDRVGCPLA